jgi:hypothetical protein
VVSGAPVITAEPVTETIDGGAASFTAAASGNPAPTVQWEVSTDAGNTWSVISGATSANYTFQPTGVPEAQNLGIYEYEAVFTNSAGSATTTPASLHIDLYSTAWSVNVDLGETYSAVNGSWVVPAVTCNSTAPAVYYQWVGIDGWGSNSVEQVGTGTECVGGQASYFMWYEMYGSNVNNGNPVFPGYHTTYTVNVGDSVNASVTVTNSVWTLRITDVTANWTFSQNFSSIGMTPYQHSAEWIYEYPPVVGGSTTSIPSFGEAAFTNCSVVANGVAGPMISPTNAYNTLGVMIMLSGTDWASPGPPNSAGTGFVDIWNPTGKS